jgi:hypothetical protein
VVSLTPLPLYSGGKSPRYPLDRRLDDVEKSKFLSPPGLELRPPSVVQPVASRYTDYVIQVHISARYPHLI